MKIFGLDDFGIIDTDLANQYADKKFSISISFSYYPDVESLRPLTPQQRRQIVCKYLRDQYKVVKDHYPSSDYQIKGTRFKPYGITGQLTGRQLARLQSNDKIKSITVEQVEGLKKMEKETSSEPETCTLPLYFSVKGLFVAQFDGSDASGKIQLTEERIVLVKALNWDEAIKKARVEFENYGQKGVLSSSYYFVTWKFLKILDVYDSGITALDPDGTEVYSIMKRRQLKPSDYEQTFSL
jgi:hypothetical protein